MTDPWRPAFVELLAMRWREMVREPGQVLWTFGFPIVLAIVVGYAFREHPIGPIPVAVVEAPGASVLADVLAVSDLRPQVMPAVEAHRRLRLGRVALVVVCDDPPRFLTDPTQPDGRTARLAAVNALASRGIAPAPLAQFEQVTLRGGRYIDFLLPGMLGLALLTGTVYGLGLRTISWRQRKLFKRLRATPASGAGILGSSIVAHGILSFLATGLFLALAWLLFDFVSAGPVAMVFAIAALGTLCFAGLALLCVARVRTGETAMGILNLACLPQFVCAGVFFSSERLPSWIQPLVHVMPLSLLNDALRSVAVEGAGMGAVAPAAAGLAAWTLLAFGLAIRLFRWT